MYTLPDFGKVSEPEEEIGLINDRVPGSREEWRVAKALWYLEIDFHYQVVVKGGTDVRGGQVLDFLLFIPFPRPAQVYGEYWHKGQLSSEERLKTAVIEQIYGYEPFEWWGIDLETDEEALETVRNDLRWA